MPIGVDREAIREIERAAGDLRSAAFKIHLYGDRLPRLVREEIESVHERLIDVSEDLDQVVEDAQAEAEAEEEDDEVCEECGGTGRLDPEEHIGDGTCPDCQA